MSDTMSTATTLLRRRTGRPRRPLIRKPAATGAPVARLDPGRVGEAKRRNPVWLAGGLLLVVLCGLGGMLLFTSADDRSPVVVAAGDLEPGRPLSRGDLRVVDMALGDGVAAMSPEEAVGLVGQLPVGEIPAGSLLNPAMFAAVDRLASGEMVFGAALDPGEAPLSEVDVGAEVRLLYAPKTPTGGNAPGPAPLARSLGSGVVWAVETLGTGQLWVSMRVADAVGLAASQAAQDDALRVVLSGSES